MRNLKKWHLSDATDLSKAFGLIHCSLLNRSTVETMADSPDCQWNTSENHPRRCVRHLGDSSAAVFAEIRRGFVKKKKYSTSLLRVKQRCRTVAWASWNRADEAWLDRPLPQPWGQIRFTRWCSFRWSTARTQSVWVETSRRLLSGDSICTSEARAHKFYLQDKVLSNNPRLLLAARKL